MTSDRNLAKLYSFINRKELPPELMQYYKRLPNEKFDLSKDMGKLKKLLLDYEANGENEEINTFIFLAILGLFSGEYKLSLFFIRKLEELQLNQEEIWLVMEIKYSIRKLDKILILTSFSKATPLEAIRKYSINVLNNNQGSNSNNELLIKDVNNITDFQLQSYFRNYEQIFLVGHGNSVSIQIGDQSLKLEDIVSKLKGVLNKPNVLGIFSCGEAFNKEEIWNHVDYFITDTFSSVPTFAEMFLLGYISSYYRNRDVLKAFDSGWILPTIRAVSDPSFTLREKGYPIKP